MSEPHFAFASATVEYSLAPDAPVLVGFDVDIVEAGAFGVAGGVAGAPDAGPGAGVAGAAAAPPPAAIGVSCPVGSALHAAMKSAFFSFAA
jgi:hypothetical protein